MENKINIAELLKDCPSGMELDCASYDNVSFDKISEDKKATYSIFCYITDKEGNRSSISFTENGCESKRYGAKCVIFPKGKTTWEGFVPPCKFKDGDVICVEGFRKWVAIVKSFDGNAIYEHAALLINEATLHFSNSIPLVRFAGNPTEIRLATEEEKQKLFDAIKVNGYNWNAETKTLEKLIEPKFKVGDRIVKRNSISNLWIVSSINSQYYGLNLLKGGESIGVLSISEQDDWELWELFPNKFDITTLVPFESRVLVRDSIDGIEEFDGECETVWRPAVWGVHVKDNAYPFGVVGGCYFRYCIPYEGNEHLLGTTNDCDEFYKTW